MADITLSKNPFVQQWLPGLLLCGLIASVTAAVAQVPGIARLGLGSLTLAIMLGIIVGNSVYSPLAGQCDAGVQLAKQKLLRLGVILFGFRITLQQITDVGLSGLLIDVLTLSSTFFVTCLLGRRLLKLDRETVWLIGAGSSICGAAAVLATEPVVKAAPSKVAVAVATVVLFGTLAIFIYPVLWPLVHDFFPRVTLTQFGIFTGSTIHEVAQVVAAGHSIAPETESSAVIAKMLRVMLLAPFLLLLSGVLRREQAEQQSAKPVTFPWFALMFVVVALFNSLHWLPAGWVNMFNTLGGILLTMAMAALGLTTRFTALRAAGYKPVLLGALVFGWLVLGGGTINLLVQRFIA
ncbi:YeiH family protein [Pantoea sp. BS_4]|uniref:YeiH family protein n=1 Tax=Pantoea TaxID=53335 RepID=UPI00073728F6|nr:YeiH family protein [Pantoea stewartii]KTS25933.1 membrane protein [Pantoea stewartii]MCU7366017.1 YeiH family protein [Pantoea stewartii]MDK2632269.1 YeiH family protein [Pantoea stewartii subsp. indologenes]MEB6533425.1 YeiH family protein [Pantoea stewartii]